MRSRLNTWFSLVLLIMTLYPICGVCERPAVSELEELLLVKENACFFIPSDQDLSGKSISVFSLLEDGTFLIGESGNTCYRVNGQGDVLNAFTLTHTNLDTTVYIRAANGSDPYVFASVDYTDGSCVIDVAASDGTVFYSQTLPVGFNYAAPIEEGLLLCGYQEIPVEGEDRSQFVPWAAKVDHNGKIVWEYVEAVDFSSDDAEYIRTAILACSDDDSTYLVCSELSDDRRWYVLQLDENGDLVDKKTLPLEPYKSNGMLEPCDVIAKDGMLLIEAYTFEDRTSAESTSYLIAMDETEIAWAYKAPKGSRIVLLPEDGDEIISIKAVQNEDSAAYNLIDFSTETQNTFESLFAYVQQTQERAYEIWITKLIRGQGGELWGAGILTACSEMHSYPFMMRFILPNNEVLP